ncbi:hypothetical protein RDI58_023316 [Solanum bulbocastanum]|uniref:Glutathione S-transferase n=1 Tax=Solanum bulbocastanum TaxID=147425 RepID=A0AAN8T9Q5_SOLBU
MEIYIEAFEIQIHMPFSRQHWKGWEISEKKNGDVIVGVGALARFWVNYFEQKSVSLWMIFRSKGEEQEKAVKDSLEMLNIIEENAFKNQKKNIFFIGGKIGMMDIAFGWICHWLKIIEDVGGVKLIEENSLPNLQNWMKNSKKYL